MKNFKFHIDYVREQFPCLSKTVNGHPAAFLDGPGGSQVPRSVVEKINDYLYYHNANAHGCFVTSQESDRLFWEAREAFADFLNCEPREIAFGANSSSNNFKLAYGLLRDLKPGDEVIITELDHEGNRSPWRILEEHGMVLKCVKVNPETCTLDLEDYKTKLTPKTKIVAINWASNATGTVSEVKTFVKLAHEVGAVTIVDAVHYAPHKCIDVKDIDTDFLVCSAYKFFGPHIGVLYAKAEVGEKMNPVRVMANDNLEIPDKFETGTLAMELASGAAAAVDFIADLGRVHEPYFEEELKGLSGRRRFVVAGILAIEAYEEPMAKKLRSELAAIDGVKVYGPLEGTPRTSTVSFTVKGSNAHDVAKFLGEKGIFVWDGDFYAIHIVNEVFKLGDQGGLVRIGLAPYNTMEEIEKTIQAVKEFCSLE
ncbi:cysteine desulfurase-like protein [Sinanaerobacter chloroacetimidivorans]|uniref:Cysteine desulfurase-like protein n=1 Tax=Sinanaerobacter chloroacetimidivorans TaxID=2818044 RepID=A0A8J7W1Y5_9FIRM|nr:cysteine desulfurase-like protein [Sinanaerobacter chloroacetimidivorans]MBR0598033.1 cysteine desulfurase-like protein [Sinanaerobacter chloroacetimidivorans]